MVNTIKKNTKIVATISDMKCEPEFLQQLFEAGVNVFRLNTAHQQPSDAKKVIDSIRSFSDTAGILIDTKGPEVRTKNVSSTLQITKGDEIFILSDDEPINSKSIHTNYSNFVRDVPINSSILIDDGHIKFTVVKKTQTSLVCRAENDGQIKNNKGVNVPSVNLDLPSISKKDFAFIDFAIKENVDFIAHSFVRNKDDVKEIQDILDKANSNIKIIAKIENEEGVNNVNEILDVAYGVMVARGDLGIEVPAAKVPLMQKQIVKTCLKRARPVIVATHMLESMVKSPRPTRAEVSDVANAILDGAGAIMLSGETAYGDFPIEAVTVMTDVSLSLSDRNPEFEVRKTRKELRGFDVLSMICESAVISAVALNAKAIVVPTVTGKTARVVASYQSRKMIYALCNDKQVVRQLRLSHGVFPSYLEGDFSSSDDLVISSLQQLLTKGSLLMDDLVIVLAGQPGHSTSFLEIDSPRNLINSRKKSLENNSL